MINLLPPEEKRDLLAENKRRTILILLVLVLFFLSVLVLILFSVKTYLQIEAISQKALLLETEKKPQQPEVQGFQEKVNLINQNLTKLSNFYKQKIYFSDILERVSQILPTQIYLNNFSATLSTAEKEPTIKIALSGFAVNRDVLLEFKQNLEKESDFKNFNFSSINRVKPIDIDFFVTFEIIQ